MAALFCTLRISEVLGLQWRHLDFKTGKIMVRQRYYRGNLDVPKSQKAIRDVAMGELSRLLAERNPGPEAADDFVFSVKTSRGVCRDHRDILQHFLRPAVFYVRPKPNGAYGPDHRNVALTPEKGMLILDVVGEKIAAVEVLYRDDVRKVIDAI